MKQASNYTQVAMANSHPAWLAIQVGIWSCLTVLSVTGNVIVLMCVILGAKRLCSSMYVYYASLATSDCLVGMFCTPLLMVSAMYQDWILGDALCYVYSAVLSTSLNASIATLCLISMDRLNAVKRPFEYRGCDTYTQRWTKRLVAFVWIHSIFWGAAPVVGWGELIRDTATFSCKPNWSAKGIMDRSYSLFLALFAFGLPVVAMVIVYCMIYHYSKKCSQWMKEHEGQKDKARENIRLLRERAVFRTVLVILCVFAGCWAVYTLTTLSKLFAAWTPPNWFVQLGLILALTGSCTNPLIYAVRDQRLVREFFRLPYLRKCLCMLEEPPTESRDLIGYSLTATQKLSLTNSNILMKSPAGSNEILYKIPEVIYAQMMNRKLTLTQDTQESLPLRIRHDLTKDIVDNMEETKL